MAALVGKDTVYFGSSLQVRYEIKNRSNPSCCINRFSLERNSSKI